MGIQILSVSDRIEETIYSPNLRKRFADVGFVISCGDLPYYYIEYIVSALDKPVYFVRGNHARVIEQSDIGTRKAPNGAIDLHRKVEIHNGVILAGIEGSIRYKQGPFQYTQNEMWMNVFRMVPAFFRNRMRYGRYLDVFITHAAPWKINDRNDWPHQGVHAFRWLIEVFRPRYHFHGHIHLYGPDYVRVVQHHYTEVINTYGYLASELELPDYTSVKSK